MTRWILVVEDHEPSRTLVEHVLRHAGLAVRGAGSVPEARRLLPERPSLVLLDLHVPGGGGEAFLAEIRATPESAATPVVAVTGAIEEGPDRFLAAGFDGFIAKPISVRLLPETVRKYLG